MSDLPPGDWSPLLVGHQWPNLLSLNMTGIAATNRDSMARAWASYAEALRSARTGPLVMQEGSAADAAQQMFLEGEQHCRGVADRSVIKFFQSNSRKIKVIVNS